MIYETFLKLEYWHTLGVDPVPNASGIYMILAMTATSWHYEVYYIGSSSDLKKRIKNHEVLRSFANSECEIRSSVKVHFLPIDNHLEYEIAAIKKFNPLANVQHNTHDEG